MKPRQDHVLLVLVFIGAATAVLAASEALPALVRVAAGAIAAGSAAVVALLRPPTGFGGGR